MVVGLSAKLKMRIWFAIVLAGALVLPAAAQTQATLTALDGEMPAPGPLTIRRLVPEVQMVFAAQDHHGRPLLNLCAPQIRVLDNGVAAPVTSFQANTTLPMRIALLLDASASMRPGFEAERQAALAFLNRMRPSCGGQVFSLAFAARPLPVAPNLPAGMDPIATQQVGGQTALFDALIAASRRLATPTPARPVLLLLSDGEDTYSRSTLAEAIAALQQAQVAVYSVSVHSSRLEYPGDRVLRQIAAATGGRAFFPPNYGRMSAIFAEMENELRGQYVVGFRPVGRLAAGEFHSVKVTALPHGTVIRARSGYYVRPAD
jgi:Ca-activated chloride channel family protein